VTTVRNFKVTLPNNEIVYVDHTVDRVAFFNEDVFGKVAGEAVRRSSIRTPWNNPQKIAVNVVELALKSGQVVEGINQKHTVMPYQTEITDAEFYQLVEEELKYLPKSFHNIVHDANYNSSESRYNKWIHTQELIEKLGKAIKEMNQ
jgi:hypothetical protein